jgi:beta-glucanase (GH16 family)
MRALKTDVKPVFEDDFDALDWSKYLSRWWYVDAGAPGCSLPSNGEWQLYVNKDGPLPQTPWTVADSILSLTCEPCPPTDDGWGNTYTFTSGMLNSWPSFWRIYGFFEARMKMPPGNGMWPAFWLLPTDGSWPPEIDTVEWLGREPLTRYCGTHSNSGGWHWTQGGPFPIPDGSADFHNYGVDWQMNDMAFTFDGETVFTCATPPDMHKPMYWILNLALGGGWAGAPDDTTPFPASLGVDWVKVYDSNPYQPNGGGGGEVIPPPGVEYVLDNPWSAVDLQNTYKPGDRVRFNFAYDFYQTIFDGAASYVWVRQASNITLACILPGRLDMLGVSSPDQVGFSRGIGGMQKGKP